VPDSMWGVVAH